MAQRRSRVERARARMAEVDGTEDDAVLYFKERVYATFTGLAIVLVSAGNDHADPKHALLGLTLGVLGITAAGFVSDVISHLAVHRDFPRGKDISIMLRIAGGALGTLVTPVILLVLALTGVMSLDPALHASIIVYIVTLGLIGWAAVRRARLVWWQQLVSLAILMALGLGVVALQTLAHAF